MTDIVSTSSYMPVITAGFSDFFAAEHVEDRFTDALQYASRAREVALEMMRDLSNLESVPGLEYKSRGFEFDLPSPDVSNITVPDPPDALNIPTFDGEFPDISNLVPPSATEIMYEDPYVSDLKDKLLSELLEGLSDPDGTYSPDVEQAVYDRARSRREADLRAKKDAAFNEFAKRGFPAPPGALAKRIQEYDIEDHREETDLNRDIVKVQADLARQRYEFLVQTGINLEGALIERARQKATTTMEKARLQAQLAVDIFNTKLRKAEIHSSLLQNEVSLYSEQVRMEALKFDAYRSQIQGVTTRAELERIKAQIFSEERQAQSDTFRYQLDQDRQNLEVAIRKQEHKREIAGSAANIAAQLASSALTSVSASASLSGSQSDSASKSYSSGIHRSDSVSLRLQE